LRVERPSGPPIRAIPLPAIVFVDDGWTGRGGNTTIFIDSFRLR
jgi:hypothetical protein